MQGREKLKKAFGGDLPRRAGSRKISRLVAAKQQRGGSSYSPKGTSSGKGKRRRNTSWKDSREQQYKTPVVSFAPGLVEDPLQGTEMFSSYPSFRKLFTRNAAGLFRYDVLCSLDLDEPRALKDALLALDEACQKSPSLDEELLAMLSERDGRPHLVAAAALAIEGGSREVFEGLWKAIDRASPAGLQLAAAASLTDENFEAEARRRIELRCPLDAPAPLPLFQNKRKKKRREKTAPSRSPEMLSALLALSRRLPGAMTWLPLHLADPEVSAMLYEDTQGGGNISLSWRERLLEALALLAE